MSRDDWAQQMTDGPRAMRLGLEQCTARRTHLARQEQTSIIHANIRICDVYLLPICRLLALDTVLIGTLYASIFRLFHVLFRIIYVTLTLCSYLMGNICDQR